MQSEMPAIFLKMKNNKSVNQCKASGHEVRLTSEMFLRTIQMVFFTLDVRDRGKGEPLSDGVTAWISSRSQSRREIGIKEQKQIVLREILFQENNTY